MKKKISLIELITISLTKLTIIINIIGFKTIIITEWITLSLIVHIIRVEIMETKQFPLLR